MKRLEIDDSGKSILNLYPLWDFLDVETQARIRRRMGKNWQPPQYRPVLETVEEIDQILRDNQDVKRG